MKSWTKWETLLCLVGAAGACSAVQGAQESGVFNPSVIRLAAQGDEMPLSRDSLFDVPPAAKNEKSSAKSKKAAKAPPDTKEGLFDLDVPTGKNDADVSKATVELSPSRDALFDLAPEKEKEGGRVAPVLSKEKDALPVSKESLFETTAPHVEKTAVPSIPDEKELASPTQEKEQRLSDGLPGPVVAAKSGSALQGFFQTEFAHANANPDHWSKSIGRLELGATGKWDGIQWKLSGRVDISTEYDHYNGWGDGNSRMELSLRENYLDFSLSDWEVRLGRQHIVWGEMVGMFVADVVSAKDLRDFILPDFSVLRIPQWAARAEYFSGDFHAELLWIPFPSYDRIGKQGADFYPYPPALAPTINAEEKPGYRLSNGNYGVRLSQLKNGWDISGFFYRSTDAQQTFYRDAFNPNLFTPRHDRIWQAGGTLAKDLGSFVLKGEAVYTHGRQYNVTNLVDTDGLVRQNTLDWAAGMDFNPTPDTRVNAQLYQRVYFNHHPDIIPDQYENGYSLLVNHKFSNNWEAEALWVRSLNRDDWMLRPKLTWGFERNWRLVLGLDYFHGPATGIFGQYNKNDRAYAELRYDF